MPRIAGMLFLVHALSRRAITGVLALWVCVLAASVGAPIARAHGAMQGWERLCSGQETAQWVVSPVAPQAIDGLERAHHGLDCPWCLQVLAPPPHGDSGAGLSVAGHVLAALPAFWPPLWSGQWPLARGPPRTTKIL